MNMRPPVDCIGLALMLDQSAPLTESRAAERAMRAAARGLRRIDAHLAQTAKAVDVVAWRWRDNVRPGLPWDVTDDEDVINGMRRTGGYEIEPLTRALSGEKAGPVDGWQPIDTAPKDGTAIIVCTLGRQIDIATWDGKVWKDYAYGESCGASHWQPLPAPPAPDKESQP